MAKRRVQKIWMLTREYDGLAGVGGVKDVTRQLAEALARRGRQVRVIMPLYGFMNPEELSFRPLDLGFDVDMSYVGKERREYITLWTADLGGVRVYLVDALRYREKRGIYTYSATEEAENPEHRQGSAHYDYFAMNILLQKTAIAAMIHLRERVDLIHCHDGHTALLPAMIREIEGYRHYFRGTGCLVTIHNAGWGYHQEIEDLAFAETITGLSAKTILDNRLNGRFDPLLATSSHGILNTVSENYARELQESVDEDLTGWLGQRLLDRGIKLAGITNGIDPKRFDPTRPESCGIAAAFSPAAGTFSGKVRCRAALVRELAKNSSETVEQYGKLSSHPSQPLFTFIGRFSEQKGVDKLIGALETLLPMDKKFQVVILGSGSRAIESSLIELAADSRHRGRICLLLGFDPALAKRVYAAGDFFLIPSRYEPCGLTDFIAQLFGSLPIVHHIGGLVKVIDGETGFAYTEHNSAALMGTMIRAMKTFRSNPEEVTGMQQAAIRRIRENFTWDKVVTRYLDLYRQAMPVE